MATEFAKATIVGNLGRDMEIRMTPSGTPSGNMSVATTRTVNGEKRTSWFNVTVFGATAQKLEKFLVKGKQVIVSGTIEVRQYQDKNGETRTSVDINADTIQLLGGGNGPTEAVEVDKPVNFDDVPF